MRSWEEIVELTFSMMQDRSLIVQKMREVQIRYEGDYIIPMPETENEPRLPALTPMLVGEVVDKTAQRAASVEPMLRCPALKPMVEKGPGSNQYGEIRRRALRATYHHSKWNLARRRAYRQLAAYYTTSILVTPDLKRGLPIFGIRDPLSSFVETTAENDLRQPCYGAFVTRHAGSRIREWAPMARAENGGPITNVDTHKEWEVVEWYDEEQSCVGLLGPVLATGAHYDHRQPMHKLILGPIPNRIGMVPMVCPSNVSLSRVASRLSTMIGSVDLQAKLMALEVIAQEKAIFPDTYAIGRESGQPEVMGGWKDGREGDINLLRDVESVGTLRTDTSGRTQQLIDRLERNFRVSNNLSPMYGGESFGSLRTGRALDSMMGISIDPSVQELHELFEAWMPEANRIALATYKEYWGSTQFSMYSGWNGDDSHIEFQPSKHFDSLESSVTYPVPGADIVQQTQILGSLLGTGALSSRSFQEMHPWIADPTSERRKVEEEELEKALRAAIVQQLAAGTLPLAVAAMIEERIRKGDDIFQAVRKAQEEAQRLQAQTAPPAPEGMIGPPESMPGLSAGPSALQQPVAEPAPQIQVPGQVQQMRELMRTMGPA